MTESLNWRISSYSGQNGSCVAVAAVADGVLVRNSNRPDRGTLALPAHAVAAFVAACTTGELDDLSA
jgi:hypothetical protein